MQSHELWCSGATYDEYKLKIAGKYQTLMSFNNKVTLHKKMNNVK